MILLSPSEVSKEQKIKCTVNLLQSTKQKPRATKMLWSYMHGLAYAKSGIIQ